MLNIFDDSKFSFQTLRAISMSSVGVADIGECLVVAENVEDGNDESWYEEWYALAERAKNEAEQSREQGHNESARSAFFRASNYYRTAEFFLHENSKDPRILETWGKSVSSFKAGFTAANLPIHEVRIPFESTTLPGYLCLADSSEAPRPLVIIQTGFDGTAEETYFTSGQHAVKRGYHCLIFEGPGQGAVIREQNIPFRHNWETVITPVVDFACSLPQVDPDKMVLMGISMGGYLVPRALAFEHRLKIGIANGGLFDFHEAGMSKAPASLDKQLDIPEAAEEISKALMKSDMSWAFLHGMYVFHAKSPVDFLKMTRPYTLKDVAQKITTKMLIVDSEHDELMSGQAIQLFDALQCPKEFLVFKSSEGAGAHCQVGAFQLSNERIYNWLANNL